MAREWITCECGAEWREEQDDECPYCKARADQSLQEAAVIHFVWRHWL